MESVSTSVWGRQGRAATYTPYLNSILTDLVACKLLCVNMHIVNEVRECDKRLKIFFVEWGSLSDRKSEVS